MSLQTDYRACRGCSPGCRSTARSAWPSIASIARRAALQHTPRAARRRLTLIELVEQAGLRGRGGAAFPLARKLRAVTAAAGRTPLGRRPIVLANASEGEPASGKDRLLLESLPHLVLDGGVLAARAVGADELIVCVDESAGAALRSTDACALRARARRRRRAADRDPDRPGGLRLRPGVGAREPLQRRSGQADARRRRCRSSAGCAGARRSSATPRRSPSSR